MRVKADLVLQLRKDRAWSQDELATASGLNLRTIQRIEKEATASLQSMKALASVFGLSIHDLEHEETQMINELLGKDVELMMGISMGMTGNDTVKGKVVELDGTWVKLLVKNKPIYVNTLHIKRIVPQ